MDRRKAREYVFIILFQYKFRKDDITEILTDFFEEHDTGTQGEYVSRAISGVVRNLEEIDAKIAEFSKDRTIERMDAVSLAALRLGVFEMLYLDDIPLPVSINEAVGLVRRYGGDESVDFVNGVLGSIQKQIEK